MLLSSFTCVRVYSHNAALCPVSAPLCPLVSPCVSSVSSHSRQSVREPVEPRIVKHPRLETRHRPWETTQSRAADLAEKAELCDEQLPQFGESGLSVGRRWFAQRGRTVSPSVLLVRGEQCPGTHGTQCGGEQWQTSLIPLSSSCPGRTMMGRSALGAAGC